MQKLATASLALVILLVSLSAYLRLDHSGIGCEPWPACYGNIGVTESGVTISDAYERLLEDTRQPMSWARPLHRLVASVLGVMILALTLLSVIRKRDRILAFSLLFLTVFLAWLGIYSEGLNNPAVVIGNLGGGFWMLGLLGWMVLRKPPDGKASHSSIRHLAIVSLAVVSLQILFGGLTSANFAASACQTMPDCHGSWLPGKNLIAAFDLTETHQIGSSGQVLGGAERADIHKLHRLTAVLTALLIISAGIAAINAGSRFRISGTLVIVIVFTEFTVGVAAIVTQLPIAMAVAHNWLAGLLLLSLLKLLADAKSNAVAL